MITSYCEDCPRKYSPIPGDGPQPADILTVGERPGQNENRYGRVFIGKTGQEFDYTYLPLAGLFRDDIRVCNAVRCWADNNRTPTDREIACCSAHHLPTELERTRPRIVILMGGSACKMVPTIKLDTHHGFPQWGRLFDWEGWIVPMYHPALGLHESRWMTQILDDWERLGGLLAAGLDDRPAEQQYETDYRRIERWRELKDYLDCMDAVISIGADTEDHGGVPWSIQVSAYAGSGRLILADDKESIGFLGSWARESSADWILHNSPHDLDILARFRVEPTRFRDTMQEAYHLSNLPQGLKPLVYRLFGFTMTSWEDVVRPYSIEALVSWIVEAREIAEKDLSLTDLTPTKGKCLSCGHSRVKHLYNTDEGAFPGRCNQCIDCSVYRPPLKETDKKGPMQALLDRLLIHTNVKSEYDPWERLHDFWAEDANEWMTSHVEARIGKYPILGIANAPIKRAVQYACGDADWTKQTEDELERRRARNLWSIAEDDADQ